MVGEDMSFRHWSISHENFNKKQSRSLRIKSYLMKEPCKNEVTCCEVEGAWTGKSKPQHVGTSCADPAPRTGIPFMPHHPGLKAGNTCPIHTGGAWVWETRLRGTKRQGRTAQNNTSEAPTGTNQPGTRWDERRGSPRLINFRIPKACKFFWTRTLAFQSIHPQPLIQNTWSRMCLAIVTFSH